MIVLGSTPMLMLVSTDGSTLSQIQNSLWMLADTSLMFQWSSAMHGTASWPNRPVS